MNEQKLQKLVKYIKENGVVIFPTETVYALSCGINSQSGIQKIREIKKRDVKKPLSIICKDLEQMSKIVDVSGHKDFIKKYSPGPMTYVLNAKDQKILDNIGHNNKALGIRIPDHPVALKLIEEVGAPLIATSVNFAGEDPASSFNEIATEIVESVDAYYDEGVSSIGVASTVVDLTSSPIKILRQGSVKIV